MCFSVGGGVDDLVGFWMWCWLEGFCHVGVHAAESGIETLWEVSAQSIHDGEIVLSCRIEH